MASSVLNPRIVVRRDGDVLHKLTACTWNCANAERDSLLNPLHGRIDLICEQLNNMPLKPDVFIMLEANRPSQMVPFTEMAATIQKATGLQYHGCFTINATPMSFGKAVFFNPKTVAIRTVDHLWLHEDLYSWGGPYFGSDAIVVHAHPVVDSKVVIDCPVRFGAVHFPMGNVDRMNASNWLNKHGARADVWMGDFNTFPDDGGAEMIERITHLGKLAHLTPKDVPFTFRAFSHDLIEKDASFASQLNEHSTFVEKEGDPSKIMVRFASVLDHVFAAPHVPCTVHVGEVTPASDHAPVLAHVICPIPPAPRSEEVHSEY